MFLLGIKFEWSSCGKILAVGGYIEITDTLKNENETKKAPREIQNFMNFYDTTGKLIYKLRIPATVSL